MRPKEDFRAGPSSSSSESGSEPDTTTNEDHHDEENNGMHAHKNMEPMVSTRLRHGVSMRSVQRNGRPVPLDPKFYQKYAHNNLQEWQEYKKGWTWGRKFAMIWWPNFRNGTLWKEETWQEDDNVSEFQETTKEVPNFGAPASVSTVNEQTSDSLSALQLVNSQKESKGRVDDAHDCLACYPFKRTVEEECSLGMAWACE